jgi:ankyrin repeat protein
MDFCETNDIKSLKTYLGNLCPFEGYLDFICINETPLAEASFYGYYDIVELLLRKGADVNFVDALDNTPLHKACKNCHLEIVELLIAKGANKDVINAYSETPEELAVECEDPEKEEAKNKIIKLLKN